MWPCVEDGSHDAKMSLFRFSLRDMWCILNVDIAPHASSPDLYQEEETHQRNQVCSQIAFPLFNCEIKWVFCLKLRLQTT